MIKDNNTDAFLLLLKSGLWENVALLKPFGEIDYDRVFRLAQEQSVVGIVAAGLEHVADVEVPKNIILSFIGATLQLEQRNKDMNSFIACLITVLKEAQINPILVKGQGVAQCYERPLWRSCGDVDLLLRKDDYKIALDYLRPFASKVDKENPVSFHQGLTIKNWAVELHGSLRGRLWRSLDEVIDEVQEILFSRGAIRSWVNNKTQVFLPKADEDIIFVFAHILQHYFRGGVGLRQICDWCRILYSFKGTFSYDLLESRLERMGVMSEWKAFAALAVKYLGLPSNLVPFYSTDEKWQRKAKHILEFSLETGSFGHNRDNSYYERYSYLVKKTISFWRHSLDSFNRLMVFPKDSMKVWFGMVNEGILEIKNDNEKRF